MNYEEKVLLIVKAVQDAQKTSDKLGVVHLYLTKSSGLDIFDDNEVWDILHKLETENKVLQVLGFPYSLNEKRAIAIDEYLYNRDSFFTVKLLEGFEKLANKQTSETKIESSLSFDIKTSKLTIENKVAFFRQDAFRTLLLGLVLKSEANRKKLWNWDEIIEAIQGTRGTGATLADKKKFYPACDGLRKAIAQKTGISDLLKFTKTTVRVNPKYLQTTSQN